jgi:hypothetical protein
MDISTIAGFLKDPRCSTCANLTECQVMTVLVEVAESGFTREFSRAEPWNECQIGLKEFKDSVPFQLFTDERRCRLQTLEKDEVRLMLGRLSSCWEG